MWLVCRLAHILESFIYIYSQTVYKGHSREPAIVPFMSSFPLYTGNNYMHNSLMGKMRLPFIDSDLLYRGAGLTGCICNA